MCSSDFFSKKDMMTKLETSVTTSFLQLRFMRSQAASMSTQSLQRTSSPSLANLAVAGAAAAMAATEGSGSGSGSGSEEQYLDRHKCSAIHPGQPETTCVMCPSERVPGPLFSEPLPVRYGDERKETRTRAFERSPENKRKYYDSPNGK